MKTQPKKLSKKETYSFFIAVALIIITFFQFPFIVAFGFSVVVFLGWGALNHKKKENIEVVNESKIVVPEEILIFKVAGLAYYDFDKVKSLLESKKYLKLELEQEPDNEYDPNAIKILLNEYTLGYVPRSETKAINDIIDGRYRYKVNVAAYDKDADISENIDVIIEVLDR